METKTALIVGASGLVGRFCLDFLLASEGYREVISLTRRPLNRRHKKLTRHMIDFGRLEEHSGFIAAGDVFCCLGTTMKKAGSREAFREVDFSFPLEVARIARRNGAERFFIITSIGADSRSLFFYTRVKGDIEGALRELGFEGLFIFRPAMLLGNREEFRLGEEIGMWVGRRLTFLMIGPLKRYRPIEAEAVARAMVRVAETPSRGVCVYESQEIQEISRR